MALATYAAAARRAARRLVETRGLVPPIDVASLIASFADVERLSWEYNVDALLVGLHLDARPQVFYKATLNPQRERFTLAHEIGHLVLPWHLPNANCSIGPDAGALDLPFYSSEDEADLFASCLLIPDVWITALLQEHQDDMSTLLQHASDADVSTIALLRGLRRVLLAGWVFTAYGATVAVATLGTKSPALEGGLTGSSLTSALESECFTSGTTEVNGFGVGWFQMLAPAELPPADADTRTTTQLLIEAIAAIEPAESERRRLLSVCNGKVGGALREASGRPASETFASLLYRFEISEVSGLVSQPDFLTWLARKAVDIEKRQTKRFSG